MTESFCGGPFHFRAGADISVPPPPWCMAPAGWRASTCAATSVASFAKGSPFAGFNVMFEIYLGFQINTMLMVFVFGRSDG